MPVNNCVFSSVLTRNLFKKGALRSIQLRNLVKSCLVKWLLNVIKTNGVAKGTFCLLCRQCEYRSEGER